MWKARGARQVGNDLEAYLSGLWDEPIKIIAREVRSWGEFSYDELAQYIEQGGDFIDWQERYADLIAKVLEPMWLKTIEQASQKATRGKVVLSDSDEQVRNWLATHGGELISELSEQSRKAIGLVILLGQSRRESPREIAQAVRGLIGLTSRQAAANLNYKERVYNRLRQSGMSESKAREQSEAAGLKYAAKQHRSRAETIVHTELAFAYNRGADIGIKRAMREGLMPRCKMIWSTAGTNRVCGRCLGLKDKVVGYSDEDGIQLPPLHPRCRCVIRYEEGGLAAGNKIHFGEGGKAPYKIGKIDFHDAAHVKTILDWAEAHIVTAPIENALIITVEGEVYHCTGDLNSLNSLVELGDKLKGAIVTHNHPASSDNEYTFSDADLKLFLEYKLARLRGVDERFIYELNRNPKDIDINNFTYEDVIEDSLGLLARHIKVIELAAENKIGYRRWRNDYIRKATGIFGGRQRNP